MRPFVLFPPPHPPPRREPAYDASQHRARHARRARKLESFSRGEPPDSQLNAA
jgi:hypothetical protein